MPSDEDWTLYGVAGWLPGGASVAALARTFTIRTSLVRLPAEGPDRVYQAVQGSMGSQELSLDGTILTSAPVGASSWWRVSSDGTLGPEASLPTSGVAVLSPDNRWMAYRAEDVNRQSTLMVAPFPAAGPSTFAVAAGGTYPRWSRDGRELFFRLGSGADEAMMRVSIDPSSGRLIGAPDRLFLSDSVDGDLDLASFDVSLDGQRFVAVRHHAPKATQAPTSRTILVQNWPGLLGGGRQP